MRRSRLPDDMSQLQLTAGAATLLSPLTPFIGREAVPAELDRLVHDPTVRPITLTRPGGVGNLLLALEVAVRDPDDVLVAAGCQIIRPIGFKNSAEEWIRVHIGDELVAIQYSPLAKGGAS